MHTLLLQHISKSFGLHPILQQVSLSLHPGERIGLVGANGVGKSTLLKIITSEIHPDEGVVRLAPGAALGYLAQVIETTESQTLADLVNQSVGQMRALESQMRTLEARIAISSGDDLQVALEAYGDAQEQFERSGGYDLDARIGEVFAGLGIDYLTPDRAFMTLSGGEKTRVGLALLLIQSPDLLLLDEPTNHLDFASMAWLESYLEGYQGAALIVSHDRQFLNRAVNAIIEIDEHTHSAKRYSGGYDSYARAREGERHKWAQDYIRQQEEIKALREELKVGARRNNNYRAHTDNDKFVRNGKIATHEGTLSKRVRLAAEKLARIEADPIPRPPNPLHFQGEFDAAALASRQPLALENISKFFGQRMILENVSLTLPIGSRTLILGENGAGKTTLLKIIAGLESFGSGARHINPAVRIGYLDQEAAELDPALTLFETYRAGLPQPDQPLKALLLNMGLFRYDELEKPVSGLSAGQKRKVQLAKLIAGGANLLILDEPTNYLSFDVLEAFETALLTFPGPIIAASHDRRFISKFNGDIWELRDGRLVGASIQALEVQPAH